MKRVLTIGIISFAGLLVFCYLGSLIYYSRAGIYTEKFTASIVPVGHRCSTLHWVPITWVSDTLSDRTAMLLPVHIDTIAKPFWIQFDLGTPITDLINLSDRFPCLKKRERMSTQIVHFQNTPIDYSDFPMRIGDSLLYHAANVPIYDQLDIDTLLETDSIYDTKIGNLGYDFIADRVLIIDFIRSRIAVVDTLPPEYDSAVEYFGGGRVNQFPIYLPIEIDGTTHLMQYDNGSSAFTIWTRGDLWNEWRDAAQSIDTFRGTSWGNEEYYCRSVPNVKIVFTGRDVSTLPIWMVSGHDERPTGVLLRFKGFMDRQFGRTIPGSIGNEYLRNDVLILDAKHDRFGRCKAPRQDLPGSTQE